MPDRLLTASIVLVPKRLFVLVPTERTCCVGHRQRTCLHSSPAFVATAVVKKEVNCRRQCVWTTMSPPPPAGAPMKRDDTEAPARSKAHSRFSSLKKKLSMMNLLERRGPSPGPGPGPGKAPDMSTPDSKPADPISTQWTKPVTDDAPSMATPTPTFPGGAPALLGDDSLLIPRNGLFSLFPDSQFHVVAVISGQYLLVSTIRRALAPRYEIRIVVHSQC